MNHEWCLHSLRTLRKLGEKLLSCSFKTLNNLGHTCPIFFPHLLLLTYSSPKYLLHISGALFAHHFPTLKALSWCFLLFTSILFFIAKFNLNLFYQDFAGNSYAQWTLISLKFCTPDFLNHLFGPYLVPSGISYFVGCTHI